MSKSSGSLQRVPFNNAAIRKFRQSLGAEGNRMARMSTGKFLGLVLGCIVVAVMLFMMFAVLGGLFSPEQ
jgi:hypothetical protein